MNYSLKKYGLLYYPNVDGHNNDDYIGDINKCGFDLSLMSSNGFSPQNVEILESVMKNFGNNCKTILEIGVNVLKELSSTYCITQNKLDDCIYLGIDVQQHKINSIQNYNKKIYGLCIDSSEYDIVVRYMKNIGIASIDLLHIDGFHSINQFLRDWRYTQLLSQHGIILCHDVNKHPPGIVLKALDPNVWQIKRHCNVVNDWGIAEIRRV